MLRVRKSQQDLSPADARLAALTKENQRLRDLVGWNCKGIDPALYTFLELLQSPLRPVVASCHLACACLRWLFN